MKALALLLMLAGAAAVSGAEKTVTLDVKDAEVRAVLKSMQKQCGIRNLVIDPDVKGEGTTLKFRQVPCSTAFRIVLRQFGLTGVVEPNIVTVEPRKN